MAGIDHLNLLLVTHFDKDHVGSAAELLETVGADQVLMPDYEGTRPEYAAFLSALEVHPETEVQRITGTETLEIPAGSVNTSLTIYAADAGAGSGRGQTGSDAGVPAGRLKPSAGDSDSI